MKIYIVIQKDRHCDTDATPFSTAEKAVEFARAKAKEYDRFGDFKETPVQGWLYHAEYSCEGDCLYVIEKTLDDAPNAEAAKAECDVNAELLAACIEALYWLDVSSRGEEECAKKLHAAIDRAEGKA